MTPDSATFATSTDDHLSYQKGKDSAADKTCGRWTKEEHNKFVEALKLYGKNWKKVEDHVGTRSGAQIRSHAQKFFNRLQREMTVDGGIATEVEVKDISATRKLSNSSYVTSHSLASDHLSEDETKDPAFSSATGNKKQLTNDSVTPMNSIPLVFDEKNALVCNEKIVSSTNSISTSSSNRNIQTIYTIGLPSQSLYETIMEKIRLLRKGCLQNIKLSDLVDMKPRSHQYHGEERITGGKLHNNGNKHQAQSSFKPLSVSRNSSLPFCCDEEPAIMKRLKVETQC